MKVFQSKVRKKTRIWIALTLSGMQFCASSLEIMLLSIAMCMHEQLIALALSGMQFCARDYVVVDCSVHEPLTSETVAVQL